MAQEMESTRVYLDANRQGVVRCRSCGVKRLLKIDCDANHLGGKSFKVKCGTCPRVFGVRCELRRHYRVDTHLPGKLLHRGTRHMLETITVTSLSAGGVGFVLQHPRPVYAGQHYEVAFVLADTQQTLVLAAILLTHLTSTGVGAAFFPSDAYNHDLDFYLVPALVERPRASGALRPPAPSCPMDSSNASSDPIHRSKRLPRRHVPSVSSGATGPFFPGCPPP